MARFSMLSLAICMAASTAANAAPDQTVSFKFDRSELSTPAGVAHVRERLELYAREQCRTISNPPINNPRAAQCTREIVDQLVVKISQTGMADNDRGQTKAVNLASSAPTGE
jgi:UrcA family protein